MEETILTKIRNEHAQLLSNIEEIEGCQDLNLKGILYHHLKDEFLEYLEAKERSIYRHFREEIQGPEAQEVTQMAAIERSRIENYLSRLNTLSVRHPDWDKIFSELKHFYLTQADLEELVMFHEAKEEFSRDELIAFGLEFENSRPLQSVLRY